MDPISKNETGFYIVSSDQELLENLNRMLKRKGFIAVTDSKGNTRYVVDGRTDYGKCAGRISGIIESGRSRMKGVERDYLKTVPNDMIRTLTVRAMMSYGFDISLTGTRVIQLLVNMMVKDKRLEYMGGKQLFVIAGEKLGLTYEQLERDVRYSIKHSSFGGVRMKTALVLKILTDEVVRAAMSKIKEDP